MGHHFAIGHPRFTTPHLSLDTTTITGGLRREVWTGISGSQISNLRAGVMIRGNLADGSRHASIVLRGTSSTTQPWFIYRAETSATSSRTQGDPVAAPYWVRLLCAGDSFTASISPDGSSWTQVGTQTIQMGSATLVGLAVSSGSTSASNTATFDNVTVKTNQVSVSLSSGPAAEGDPQQPATFGVSRGTQAPPATLAVPLVLSGTAGHPDDYSLSGGGVSVSGNISTINIPSGSESVEIAATPINDLSNEGTETLIVTIQNSPDYLIGAPSSAEVQILDQSVHELTVIGGTAGSFVGRSGDSPADWTHPQTVEVGADADNHVITLPSSGTRRFYQLVYTTPPP